MRVQILVPLIFAICVLAQDGPGGSSRVEVRERKASAAASGNKEVVIEGIKNLKDKLLHIPLFCWKVLVNCRRYKDHVCCPVMPGRRRKKNGQKTKNNRKGDNNDKSNSGANNNNRNRKTEKDGGNNNKKRKTEKDGDKSENSKIDGNNSNRENRGGRKRRGLAIPDRGWPTLWMEQRASGTPLHKFVLHVLEKMSIKIQVDFIRLVAFHVLVSALSFLVSLVWTLPAATTINSKTDVVNVRREIEVDLTSRVVVALEGGLDWASGGGVLANRLRERVGGAGGGGVFLCCLSQVEEADNELRRRQDGAGIAECYKTDAGTRKEALAADTKEAICRNRGVAYVDITN